MPARRLYDILMPPSACGLSLAEPPSSKEMGSVLDESVPKTWLRDGDLCLFIQEGFFASEPNPMPLY
jgi:hypothetical protein